MKAGCSRIYTYNIKHFKALAPDGIEVTTPLSPNLCSGYTARGYPGMIRRGMDKSIERFIRKGDQPQHAERIDPCRALQEIWPLSRQMYALSGRGDVQSRLQKSVETIQRPRR
jgi:hypothetical protein